MSPYREAHHEPDRRHDHEDEPDQNDTKNRAGANPQPGSSCRAPPRAEWPLDLDPFDF